MLDTEVERARVFPFDPVAIRSISLLFFGVEARSNVTVRWRCRSVIRLLSREFDCEAGEDSRVLEVPLSVLARISCIHKRERA